MYGMASNFSSFFYNNPSNQIPKIEVVSAPEKWPCKMDNETEYNRFKKDFKGYNALLDEKFLQKILSFDKNLSEHSYKKDDVQISIPLQVEITLPICCIYFNGKKINKNEDLVQDVYKKMFEEFSSSIHSNTVAASATDIAMRLCSQKILAIAVSQFLLNNVSESLNIMPIDEHPNFNMITEVDSKTNKIKILLEKCFKFTKADEEEKSVYNKLSMFFIISKDDLLNADLKTSEFARSECFVNLSQFFEEISEANDYNHYNIQHDIEDENKKIEFIELSENGNTDVSINISNLNEKNFPSDAKDLKEYNTIMNLLKPEKVYRKGVCIGDIINNKDVKITIEYDKKEIAISSDIVADFERMHDIFINNEKITLLSGNDEEKQKTRDLYLKLLNLVGEPAAECVAALWNQVSFVPLIEDVLNRFMNADLDITPFEVDQMERSYYLNIKNDRAVVSVQMCFNINTDQPHYMKIAMITELPLFNNLGAKEMLNQSNIEFHYSPVYSNLDAARTYEFSTTMLPIIPLPI